MSLNTLQVTKEWFEKAIPNPTSKNFSTQLGCHIEEVVEMLDEISFEDSHQINTLESTKDHLTILSNILKSTDDVRVYQDRRIAFLDAMTDQIVTSIGTSHMLNMQPVLALDEVNRSNYSKFVDNEPIFNENKKILKGPDYTEPVLDDYI